METLKINTMKKGLTQKAVRQLFWDTYPQFKSEFRTRKRQNDYSCEARCTFVEFTEFLFKDGQITEKQVNNYTL